ncbi:MAG: PAS domain S-box protein [Flavobacteriales bacterium]|nr:PAS domain S-box protein [Flavobacteriales bacterium]
MYKDSQNINEVDSELTPALIDGGVAELFKKTGQEYFDALVYYLCEKMSANYAFIGVYNEKNHSVFTKSFYADNSYVKGYEYDLKDTPCSTVIDNELCFYPKDVQQLFPKDEDLKTFRIESYIGLPLFDLDGKPVGIVVVMNNKPIEGVDSLKFVLNLIESKTELELERLLLKEKKGLSQKDFLNVFEHLQDVFFIIHYNENNQQMDLVITPSVQEVLGYSVEEFKSLKFSDLYADPIERIIFLQLIKVEKQVKNYSVTIKNKEGVKLNVELDVEYISENLPKGAVFGLRGVLKDVTKKYKESLRVEMAYLIAEKSQRRLTSIKHLAEFIHNTLEKVMNVSNFYIALHDVDKNELYMPVFIDEFKIANSSEIRVPFANGLTEYIIKSKNVIVKDKKGLKELIYKEELGLRGELSESYVGVPLKSVGKCFGVMVMQSYKKGYHFSKEDIELLKFISTQVAYVVERTQWQESLIKKEEHYRSLVENSSEIIGIINGGGILEYVSESIYRITGYKSSELVGRNIANFVSVNELTQIIKDRISIPSIDKLEVLKILDKQGGKKYLEISLNKYKDNELIFNAKDITDRVIADKKNEVAQNRLKTLHQIEKALLSDNSLSKILNDALQVITKNIFDVDRASVGSIDYEKERVEIIALKTKYKTINGVKINEFIPFKEMASLSTILKKKTYCVNDISHLKNVLKSDKKNNEDGIVSYYIRPIVINDRVIGTFNFGSKMTGFFKSVDENLLDEITQLVAVVISDTTLKKELAERESELRTIFNSTSEGILKISKNNKVLVVNKGICDLLGYTEKELLKKSIMDITCKEDEEITKKEVNSLIIKKAVSYNLKKRLVHKNGSLLDVRISTVPFYNVKNKFDYSISFIHDETNEKKALKKVFDLENVLNYSAAVFFTNINGRITDLNKGLETITGYSRKEILGSSPNIFNSKYHPPERWKDMWVTIKSGKTWKGEIRNRRKDGSIYWVFVTITPILSNTGIIEQFSSIQFDITKDKIEKSNLVREVIEAQEVERERFAMEIHDGLGQILLAAKMNLSALNDLNEGLDEESKKVLNNSVDLLTEAVQEARSISHGLMSRVLNRFGLAYAINEIVININATLGLEFSFKHNIEDIRFNEEIEMGIYRTLQELIKNIIKHSKSTRATLNIIKKENELFIEIKDNGIGIEKGTINNPKSGGIGLRNMRSRVEYLGGAFKIDNKIKIGTKIEIHISL